MYDVTSTALQTSNTPNSTADVCKSASAPATQRSSTPRNVRFYLTPATILQQTAATRPPALPCEPHLLTSFLPSQVPCTEGKKRKRSLTFLLCPACIQRAWPGLLVVCIGGVGVWAAFLAYAANQERLSSSAMRRVLSELRESEDVRAVLGDAVRPEPTWYLNGSPWVYGSVCGTQALTYGAGEGAIITASLILATSRSRCYRETSTSASASRVTRVRAKSFFGPSHLYLSYSSGMGRRWHGLLYEYPQRAWRTFYDLCVSSFSPIPRFPIACSPNVFHTVRFKVIADDGTVILIPCEASPVGNR